MCPSVSKAEAIEALLAGAEPAELPAIAGELALALAGVLARLATPASSPVRTLSASTADEADTLLTVEQAAARLGVKKSWLYRHSLNLPFTRKLGHRTVRYDARGLERWANARSVR
jgi:predicted DNA-binding transcriptional regulator AlpA